MFCFTTQSCKKDKNLNYYVITDTNSTRDSVRKINEDGWKTRLISPRKNWYSPFVILLDSTDKVYIYQTEDINRQSNKKTYFDDEDRKCLEYTEYSNYIGLNPQQLLAFESDYFIEFIKNNQDIFELDTLDNDRSRYFIIATNEDTIRNVAFYDLKDLITKKGKNKRCHTNGLVRKTTEEENVVMYHKRKNIEYYPEQIKWSTNFINGKYRPFTKEYIEEEREMKHMTKAINVINNFSHKTTEFKVM